MPDNLELEEIDYELRERAKSFCSPIWWESGGQTVVNNGSMCLVKTAERLFGITNHHVFETYKKHKVERIDIFCQLGSGPFDPTANQIESSEYWDLATFTIPDETLRNFGHKVFLPREWPPRPVEKADHVVFGGYPEDRRVIPTGRNPKQMKTDFVSFRGWPHRCSPEQVSFQIIKETLKWLPDVEKPLDDKANFSGMSGGPCFRIIPAEDRIELAAIIYEGRWDMGIVFAMQLTPIDASGHIAPMPPGATPKKRGTDED